ncbi:MAG TPA: AAA family ATPase [Candidatus Saccharimonadales bacterium]|nr:AAA family ATPase [Candidatus Saccharimonadales bacterium]
MKLIILEGGTSVGKSTIARKLAADLHVSAFLKDDYKEKVFDSLHEPLTLKRAHEIEKDSWNAVFEAAGKAVSEDKSIIIEGNFYRSHRRAIQKRLAPNAVVVEIYCYAKGFTVLKRYIKRNHSGKRHPGHKDHLWYGLVALEAPFMWLEKYIRPMRLSSNFLKVNTEDFARVDYRAIERCIKHAT